MRRAKCILIDFADNSWKRWPDGDYSIPMSIYGCPEQEINKWSHGYINFTMDSDSAQLIRYINGEKMRHQFWDEMNFFLLGPYGKRVIQMNFCSKQTFNGKLKGGEWPRGSYAVFSNDGQSCPYGRFSCPYFCNSSYCLMSWC